MRNKVFKNMFLTAIAVFIACFAVIMSATYTYFSDEQITRLEDEAAYIETAIQISGDGILRHNPDPDTTVRISLFDSNGDPIYDSKANPDLLGNHSEREEIKEAIEYGRGDSRRYSDTLSEQVVNFALKLHDGRILRVSELQYSVFTLIINMFYPLLAVIMIAILLSLILSSRLSRRLIEPIVNLNTENPDDRDVYPELRPLVCRINQQNKQITKQMTQLKKEHKKRDSLRREFTANVTHELKTPLTSISGYAEIMRDGIAKPEDVSRFSGKIYDEAQRLISLVEDIIKLSRLEEGDLPGDIVSVDLLEEAYKVTEHLDAAIKKHGITVSVLGENIKIHGTEKTVYDIIYNLCDNAVKYNKDGGSITISVFRRDTNAMLSVTDTGIGIAKEDIGRIFERFYRVDKSHSKEVGGTGLGLSIVKHGVVFLGAKIEVDSKLGEGTSITVTFPDAI